MIQLSVINYLLDTKDSSFLLLNNFTEEYFSDHKAEFNFIKSHYEQYGLIPDKTTFLSKFPEFPIIAVNEPPKYLVEALIEDYNKRKLIDVFNKVASYIKTNQTDKALELYRSASDSFVNGSTIESIDITSDTSRYDRYIERCEDLDTYYVSTGFKELDDIFGGWDRQEELATIVARSNQGKSWLLLKTALAAAKKGLNVGIYSGEMTVDKVAYRVDTLASNLSNSAMTHGNIGIQLTYKQFLDSIKEKIPGSIKILTPTLINGPAGVTALRAFIEKEHLDMLCVDQHSLLEDDRGAKNPVERASNISKDLKNLQVLKKIPIITVSQQNRNSTEDGVDLTHIAQSDRIGQDSTIVIAFEQKDGVLKLHLIKSRDSGAGKKLEYAIDFDKGVFTYMPSEDDAVGNQSAIDSLKDDYEFDKDEVF